jgi:uncharacterized protein YjbJ (UPF0337 family)
MVAFAAVCKRVNGNGLIKNRAVGRKIAWMLKINLNQAWQETCMNWNAVKGNWTLVRGNTKLQWGRLAHDPLSMIGRHNPLTGKIQQAYGTANQMTEEQLKEFVGPHPYQGPSR